MKTYARIKNFIETSAIEEYFNLEMERAMTEEYLSILGGDIEPIQEIHKKASEYMQKRGEGYNFRHKNAEEFFPMINDYMKTPISGELYGKVMKYLLYNTTLDELNADMVTKEYFARNGI